MQKDLEKFSHINVSVSTKFGIERFYPNCEFSSMLCQLMKRGDKTAECLTRWQIEKIKEAGIKVKEKDF